MEFSQILSQIFYFVIIIGVLVLIHELGHFLAAKAFGMRVDRFSIGFPPRAFGRKIGDTDYCVSWLPIGGYVKIAGMIDESLDTEHLARAPEPWEFRAKPVWQRIIVISAGVIMNLVLAVLILWGLLLSQGRIEHVVTTVGAVAVESPAARMGLRPGDRITAVNGERAESWEQVQEALTLGGLGQKLVVDVRREGRPLTLHSRGYDPDAPAGFGASPTGAHAVIAGVEPGMPASRAGLKPGDVIVSIAGVPVYQTGDVIAQISSRPGTPITVVIERDKSRSDLRVTPTSSGKIGIMPVTEFDAPTRTVSLGVFAALGAGVTQLVRMTDVFLTNIWHIIIGQASFKQSIGGPVMIARMAAQSAEAGIVSFLSLMALLSISLAIINIFPIPALDGGHLVFLVFEGIFRREMPVKVKIAMQQAGMVLLLALMVFVIYNDIFR